MPWREPDYSRMAEATQVGKLCGHAFGVLGTGIHEPEARCPCAASGTSARQRGGTIVSRTRRKARCCMKDEGRSLGAALWEEAPNRRKLLRLKDAVVNVPVKRRGMIASGADWEGERK